MKKLTLNIGSGDRTYETYPDKDHKCINIDERSGLDKVDVVGDVRNLPFPDENFDYILASDIIEHFPKTDTAALLQEWRRVLKLGGYIEFRTPDLEWMVNEYLRVKDWSGLKFGETPYLPAEWVSYHIFGDQQYSGNFHYVIFDVKWLSHVCQENGLRPIKHKSAQSNFILWAIKEVWDG